MFINDYAYPEVARSCKMSDTGYAISLPFAVKIVNSVSCFEMDSRNICNVNMNNGTRHWIHRTNSMYQITIHCQLKYYYADVDAVCTIVSE